MNTEDEVFLKIDQYLHGELDDLARIEFEKEINTNEALRTQVNSWKAANELILEHRLLNVSSSLTEVHAQTKRNQTYRKLAILAALLIVAGAIVFFFFRKVEETNLNSSGILVPKESEENATTHSSVVKENALTTKTTQKINNTNLIEQESQVLEEESDLQNSGEDLVSTPQEIPTPSIETPEVKSVEKSSEAKKYDCKLNPISVELRTNPSCRGKETGSVFIKEISGGEKPYHMFIIDQDGEKSANNRNLKAGTYVAEISDEKNCSVKQKFVITSQNCSVDYAFNPGVGEELEIPEYSFDGELSIQDISGKVVFEKSVSAGNAAFWNGYTNQGELKPGYYQYKIVYRDNSIHTGTITVVP